MERASGSDPDVCTISCPCGAPLKLTMKSLKPVEVCPECQVSLTIVVTQEPKTEKRRIGILVNPETVIIPPKRSAKRAQRAPKAEPSLSGIHNPKCACGARVPVDLGSVDAVYSCPWCGACYTAVAKRDDAKGVSLPLLMPVEVVSLPKETRRKTRRIPAGPKETGSPSPPAASRPPSRAGREKSTTDESLWAQPLPEEEKGDLISCPCGGEISVKKEDHKKVLQCSHCSGSFRYLRGIHPGSKKPMAILVRHA